MKKILYIATIGFTLLTSSCNDFLDRQVPQGIVTGDQIASPEYVDNLVISAYAIWATGDDLLKQFLQHEVGVSAQESHFSNALVLQRISLFIHLVE